MSFRLPKHQPAPLRGSIGRSPLFPPMPEPESTGVLRQGVNEQQSRSLYVGETSLTRSRTSSEFGASRSITVTAESHSMKQKGQWLEAARKSTEHFRRHGSAVPLVWVLVEDNNIPPNAVPFGEDRQGAPLYVARALLEGGLHLGKAGPQLHGALIGYAGKERTMTHYEVLVCASQLRWGFPPSEPHGVLAQGTVVLAQQHKEGHHQQHKESRHQQHLQKSSYTSTSLRTHASHHVSERESLNTTLYYEDIPRYIPDFGVELDREAQLQKLAEVKTVILVDDSISMCEGDLWEQAREALAGIVDISNRYGSKGADIHFMHHDDYAPNMESEAAVKALFNRVQPEGHDTPTGAKLGQLLEHYLPLIEREGSTHEPITIIVITDGVATDQEELLRCIVDAAHRLDRHRVREELFGIQFVQIGTDQAAAEVLHELDDHLVEHYKIRDMVDSTPFNPAQGVFDTEYMLKILLGGIRKDLDNSAPNAMPSVLSPTSVLSPSLGSATLSVPLVPTRPLSAGSQRSVGSARLGRY